jgi:LysM repeat protein
VKRLKSSIGTSKLFQLLLAIIFIALTVSTVGTSAKRTFAAPEAYVVAPGDTLLSIADRFGLSVSTLMEANNLKSPDFLQAGQILMIPGEAVYPISHEYETAPAYLFDVPFRTQFDDTRYAESNCGPATLGMILSYYGVTTPSDDLRALVNRSTGVWSLDGGSDWESLVYAAAMSGFRADGLYSSPTQYRHWSVDDLFRYVRQGLPVMLLVRYRTLPGHEWGGWWGDHYIVVIGTTWDGRVIYHDSAFEDALEGSYRTMTKERLRTVWGQTSVGINYTGMVLETTGE